MTKRNLIVTIILSLVAVVIVTGFFISQRQTAAHQESQTTAVDNQEKAYENIIRDSLDVYHSRYSKYPKDYQALLDDIARTPDIYGVNDEGMNELKTISDKLSGFSYSTIGNKDYMFTYQKANSGETATVTNN